MKRKRYSTLVKSILFVIQSILAVSLAVFVVLLQSCVNQNMLNLGDLSNSSFVDSGYFEKITDQQTQNVLEYLELKQKLETDGRYDEAKAASEGVREEDIITSMRPEVPICTTGWEVSLRAVSIQIWI